MQKILKVERQNGPTILRMERLDVDDSEDAAVTAAIAAADSMASLLAMLALGDGDATGVAGFRKEGASVGLDHVDEDDADGDDSMGGPRVTQPARYDIDDSGDDDASIPASSYMYMAVGNLPRRVGKDGDATVADDATAADATAATAAGVGSGEHAHHDVGGIADMAAWKVLAPSTIAAAATGAEVGALPRSDDIVARDVASSTLLPTDAIDDLLPLSRDGSLLITLEGHGIDVDDEGKDSAGT